MRTLFSRRNAKRNGRILLILIFVGFVAVKLQRIDSNMHAIAKGSTRRFLPSHIVSQFEHNPQWEVTTSPELVSFVNVITQQPFRWLNKGLQAYAFESQDGEYVLKFFQQQRLRDKPLHENFFQYLFSQSFRDKTILVKVHRDEIFVSSKLAFEEIAQESGILYVHLNKTDNLLRGVKIIDATGQSYRIRPDDTSFLIQRKAHYILPTITALMNNKDIRGAKMRLDQIFDLLVTLAKKGMVDGDNALIRNNNIGFIRDRAIYIDTGHIVKQADLNVKKQMEHEFHKRLEPLYEWLCFNYPELASYYDMRRQEIIASLSPPAPMHIALEQ